MNIAVKNLDTTLDIKTVMKDYFLNLNEASLSKKKKIAWCTSVGPAEILRALDFEVFFPENHGALLGATRMSGETIPEANSYGYSPDICSYLTSDIGAFLKKITPLSKAYGIQNIPRPDVLVYNTNQCKDVMHWFEFYAKEFKVPIVGVHSPRHLNEVEQYHIADVVGEFKKIISVLESIVGKKMNYDQLSEVLLLSKQATYLWEEVLNTAQHQPSPLSFFDSTIYMGPIVVLRGTPQARQYYECLLKDMKNRIANGVAAVPGEKIRVYWEGMPVWGRLRALSDLLASNKTAAVVSTYCNSWVFPDFNPKNPLESMAASYLKIFINRGDSYKLDYIEKMVHAFKVDGVIFHESKTCPNNSNSQYNLPLQLRARGIKTIIVNGDLCDLRCYADEQATTVIEAFLETL